ncbi:MAG: sensor histidine kinase [Thalassotalea sp.]
MKVKSISKKLLTRVLSFYFVLTFIVTGIQIVAEYINTKAHINNELLTLEKTFSGSLTRAVWELNTQQAIDIADGLVAIPMIKGISVKDENEQIIAQLGQLVSTDNIQYEDNGEGDYLNLSSFSEGLFGHTFPLIFEFSGRTSKVGSVTLLSSNEVIFNRIEVGIYFLIGNAMVKTAVLVLLFSLAFSKLLTAPLSELTQQIQQFDIDDPEASKLHSMSYEENELNVLEDAYNNLIDELVLYKDRLHSAQNEIIEANSKLDEHNLQLEQEVARKTSSLSTSMLKMEKQKQDLLLQQKQLEAENTRRKKTQETLLLTNKDLKKSIFELKKAQDRLLDAEKMAALGSLSAEVTHEVNTPIGVGITSTSYLAELLNQLNKDVNGQKLTKKSLADFIDNATKSISLLTGNLNRASDLISSYKQVAVDQTSNKIRNINLADYIDGIIHSLHPKLKNTKHTITVNCPADLEITVQAGAVSQIITNLIINSLIHGFEGIEAGQIMINIAMQNNVIKFNYSDSGHGVNSDQLENLFAPFYTTKAMQGGTGLGTHIIQNLVTDTLNGKISATSEPESGLHYAIEFANMT